MQLAELSWALPAGKSDDPVKPREKAGAASPPAPPLYRYPVLKRRAANLRADKPPPARGPVAAPRPAPKPSAPSEPSGPDAPSEPSAPTAPGAPEPPTMVMPIVQEEPDHHTEPKQPRPKQPASLEGPTAVLTHSVEEVDMDSIEASNPVASGAEDLSAELDDDEEEEGDGGAGAFGTAEPPRGSFSPRAYGEEDDAETRVIPSRPPPPLGPLYVGPHVPPASERPPPLHELAAAPGAAPRFDEEDEEIPRIPPPPRPPPADLAAYAGMSRERAAAQGSQRSLYLTAAGTVALALAVGFLLFRGSREEGSGTATRRESAVGAPSSSAGEAPSALPRVAAAPATEPRSAKSTGAPTGPRCTIVTSATRIADWAEPAITPSFAAIPGSERIAVGFGQSDTYAIGITIDSRTLDRDQVFREFRKQKLVSVVPTTYQDKLHFDVVRVGDALDNARAVDASPPFWLGTTPRGIERAVGKGAPEPVWSFAVADEVTVPRVATLAGVGHAVTFRRGGQAGRIVAGWLEPSGRKRTELTDVSSAGHLVGHADDRGERGRRPDRLRVAGRAGLGLERPAREREAAICPRSRRASSRPREARGARQSRRPRRRCRAIAGSCSGRRARRGRASYGPP